MKRSFYALAAILCLTAATPAPKGLVPLPERVNVQADSARVAQIIDGQWVGVGTDRPYAIQHDYTLPFEGKPSYRFELKAADNTLQGYNEGDTKGRAELSYAYATAADFASLPEEAYHNAQIVKTVYHYGKGHCGQGSTWAYRFSFRLPADFPQDVNTIFAQWHGMPSRTLVQTPDGQIKQITEAEFVALCDSVIFKKDTGHTLVKSVDKQGKPVYKAGEKNGWIVEQGGYPPIAFGLSDGYFYVKLNSDRKWLSDKTDRTSANNVKTPVMQPVSSAYKTSTIVCRMPMSEFPRDTWVTFDVRVQWTAYSGPTEQITRPGNLDIKMSWENKGKPKTLHLVDNQTVQVGRNDDYGYYFKFGIYRVGNSETPVVYNHAGYSEHEIK